ncbi:hypothetical protein C0993_006678 [Termitomyces sp. T159_Od127]|nr:hypothetical protein C0993_006678 [Termitomyces sp. T159_Od127]
MGIWWAMDEGIKNAARGVVVDTTKAVVQNAKAYVEETKDEMRRVVDTTKSAVQDAKAYVKETKDEVKEIFDDTRGHPREKIGELADLAKKKRAKWQARKDKGRDDGPPQSEDETP